MQFGGALPALSNVDADDSHAHSNPETVAHEFGRLRSAARSAANWRVLEKCPLQNFTN